MAGQAMTPHGRALSAYFKGEAHASLLTRRDDGFEFAVPASHFFREPQEFTLLERTALDACRGRVLDLGAGSGLHTLALQDRGLEVTAIDVVPEAVEIMRARGVRDARIGDVLRFVDGPFDTLLMLGHGVGMTGNLDGLARFLEHAAGLLQPAGRLLLDSVDVRRTADPVHQAYHEQNRRMGRYVGVIRMQIAFEATSGPMFDWLHVDPETLGRLADSVGWAVATLAESGGEYLARLTRRQRP